MKATKIVVFGLVFAAISLGLFSSPVFVQKAKAWDDSIGPFQSGTHIAGAYAVYNTVYVLGSDGQWHEQGPGTYLIMEDFTQVPSPGFSVYGCYLYKVWDDGIK